MSKLTRFVAVSIAALLVGGCLDVTQYISKDKRGLTNVYLKVAIAKSLMELAKSESSNFSDPFEDQSGLQAEDVFKGLPAGTQMTSEKIDNDFEQGFSMSIAMDFQQQITSGLIDPSQSIPFVPIDRGTKVTIDLPASGDAKSDNPLTDSMMKSFKYRLIIAKSFMPKISRVIVSTKNFDYKPELVSLSDIYLIEMPIGYLMTPDAGNQIVLEK
jgi:hypothetical protein